MFKDDRFSLERSDAYDLLLEVQRTRFRFALKLGAETLYLEDHFLGLHETATETIAALCALVDQHPFLTRSAWKEIFLFSDFQLHTLLPAELGKTPAEFLQIAYPTAPATELDFSYVPLQKQYLHFASLKTVHQAVAAYFPGVQLRSATATALHYAYRAQSDVLYVTDRYADSCTYLAKPQAVAVRRVRLADLRTLPSHKNAVAVFGEVTPYSALFEEIRGIYPQAKMGEWTGEDELSGKYSTVPQHRYFSLLAFNGFSDWSEPSDYSQKTR